MRFRRPNTDELNENWQPRLYGRLVALLVVVAYAIAFVLENRKQVNLHFVFVTASVSLIWLILLSLALGVVGGILLAQLERRRRRRRAA
ncbi:MAG: lipopolysaccharide assembly protein LapA domain-containing protein [Actinomycetota bacterium]